MRESNLLRVLVLIKDDEERYVFLFRAHQKQALLRMLGKTASNPELSFSWRDAAKLASKLREPWPDECVKR